jgi:hypothetical protein
VLYNLREGKSRLFDRVRKDGMAPFLTGNIREQRTAPAPQRKLSIEQRAALVRDYKAGVGSIYDLAKIYLIAHQTVSAHLRAAGLKLGKQPLSDREIEKARELRIKGLSFNAIGRTLGRDPKTVKSVLL